MPQCLSKTKPRLFADDTNLTASGDSIPHLETAVNSDLENLRKWLIANRLTLNVAKTEFMLIGSKQMIKSISDLQLNVIFIDRKTIVSVYNAIVRPYFDYCCEVKHSQNDSKNFKIEQLES